LPKAPEASWRLRRLLPHPNASPRHCKSAPNQRPAKIGAAAKHARGDHSYSCANGELTHPNVSWHWKRVTNQRLANMCRPTPMPSRCCISGGDCAPTRRCGDSGSGRVQRRADTSSAATDGSHHAWGCGAWGCGDRQTLRPAQEGSKSAHRQLPLILCHLRAACKHSAERRLRHTSALQTTST
jgi:hypothetical protein